MRPAGQAPLFSPAALHSRLRLNSASLWKNTFALRPIGRPCLFRAFLFAPMGKSLQGWPGQRGQAAGLQPCPALACGFSPVGVAMPCPSSSSLPDRAAFTEAPGREVASPSGSPELHHLPPPPTWAQGPCFLDEETEAQWGEVTSPRPHNKKEKGLRFEPQRPHCLCSWAWSHSGGSSFHTSLALLGLLSLLPQLPCPSSRQLNIPS